MGDYLAVELLSLRSNPTLTPRIVVRMRNALGDHLVAFTQNGRGCVHVTQLMRIQMELLFKATVQMGLTTTVRSDGNI